MKTSVIKKIALFTVIALCLILYTGCGERFNVYPTGITVILVNGTSEDCHLWIGHDGSPNPENKVAPGGAISYSATVGSIEVREEKVFDDKVYCGAGKNGKVIKSSKVGLTGEVTDSVTITWNGSNFKRK